jgi:Tfp pilus assembly pilus retraction ATPase PilT
VQLEELLAFAVKHQVLELRIEPGKPPLLKLATMESRVNVPPLQQADYDALVAPLLDDQARESLRFLGRCEFEREVASLGRFRCVVTPASATITPPVPDPNAKKPGLFGRLFGG